MTETLNVFVHTFIVVRGLSCFEQKDAVRTGLLFSHRVVGVFPLLKF